MLSEYTSAEVILFSILYAISGAMPLFAAVYLLLRRGNAFAPDITPPVRLRRWAASFFAVAALGHVWWLLFYIFSSDIRSVSYIAVVMLDWVTLLPTVAGTLLAMLQDRRRPVWPIFVAMIPIVALGGGFLVRPDERFMHIFVVYIVLLYMLFAVYVAFAVRQYGRWLLDNYVDLERKEVWLTHVLSLVFMLLFIFYALVDTNIILIYLLHVLELALFTLLLWRVETLPSLTTDSLTTDPSRGGEGSDYTQGGIVAEELSTPLPHREGTGESLFPHREGTGESLFPHREEQGGEAFDLDQIERLLKERCVDTQLYLQHNLTLQQLAMAVGTNRSYLSQYFSRQSNTYNTYINNLRVNHFIKRYEETVAARQPVVAQELAYESGFSSYRTFSRAFTQRTGQSVTAWMSESGFDLKI